MRDILTPVWIVFLFALLDLTWQNLKIQGVQTCIRTDVWRLAPDKKRVNEPPVKCPSTNCRYNSALAILIATMHHGAAARRAALGH